MERPNDKNEHAGGDAGRTSEALVAARELERRKHESSTRLAQLEQERRMLEEIRNSLDDEERLVGHQLAVTQMDHDRISEKVADMARGVAGMEGEIEKHKREIAVLERRCSDNQLLREKLLEDIASAEKLLSDERDAVFSVSEELELGRATVARMDQRLSACCTRRRAVSET